MLEASHFDPNVGLRECRPPPVVRTSIRTSIARATWARPGRRSRAACPRRLRAHRQGRSDARKGLLFAGSERGAFVSFDDGDNWQSLQLNLPVTSVRDFEVYGNDLIVATHGRGFWVIDDIASCGSSSADVTTADAYLFKPIRRDQLIQGDDNGTPRRRTNRRCRRHRRVRLSTTT